MGTMVHSTYSKTVVSTLKKNLCVESNGATKISSWFNYITQR
jgi:hypothetical protein